MWIGRFLFLIPLLAAAGSLAAKKKIPSTAGTFPTHGPLFVGLLVGTVIIVGALTFFPALSLGPIVEHYLMHSGKLFSMILLPLRDLELAMAITTTEPKVTPQTSAGRSDVASAQEAGAGAPAVRSGDRQAGNGGILRQAEPGHLAEEPGDVRRRGGRRDHHHLPDPRSVHRRQRHRFPGPDLACGSGSRSCSRTSPKPWRKRAARPRQMLCARPRRTSSQNG